MIIGLTGTMGSGKTTVADMLSQMGATVIDADKISKQLTRKNGKALPYIQKEFGDAVFDADGELKRDELAKIVFNDLAANEKLNAIIHPLVISEMKEESIRLQQKDDKTIIIWDVPLLFETNIDKYTDKNWVVIAPEEECIKRAIKRSGIERAEAEKRIRLQMPQEKKAELADEIIDNSASLEDLTKQVSGLYKRLVDEKIGNGEEAKTQQ